MESPRVIPADKVDIPTDTSDQTSNLVSEIPPVDPSKISQDSEINNAKAINHENSRIPPEASLDVQDLSETTKSDRKSTGEAEETQSQQAQQVKSEEDNVEGGKSSDDQAAENLPESREAEEVPQEGHQSSESQENISQENIENKESNKSEPELQEPEEKVQEQEIQPEEKVEEQIQEVHVDSNNIKEESNEVPQSENVVSEVDQRDSEVKEEPVVVNTEVKNEEQPVVESQPVEEPQEAQNEQPIPEPKVENIEVQEPAKEPEAPIEENKPVEEVAENKVEEQNNKESVQQVEPVIENKVEEQNNTETIQVNEEEIKPVEEVSEIKIEEQNNHTEEVQEVQSVVENKPEEQNNNEIAQPPSQVEEVVKTEEIQEPVIQVQEEVQTEQKPEPVVEQQKGVFDFPVEAEKVEPVVENKPEEQNNEVVQVSPQEEEIQEPVVQVQEPIQEEAKPVEPVIEQQKDVYDFPVQEEAKPIEPVVEQQKGVYDFPVEATQETKTEESNKPEEVQPAVAVEEKKEEAAPEEIPKETRSPKLKNLRINTQQNNVVTRIINYCAKTGDPLPDASVAEPQKTDENSGEQPTSQASVNSEGSSEVKKHYDNNQSLTDLLKPINMEEPQASPIIKRNATSTTCLANPSEENKEETKEAQQPASAMIQSTSKARLTMDDFQKITSLGRGSYGEVFLVKKIANGKLYALKSIDKNFMKKEKKEHQVYVEREVLMKLNHPNIIKLVSSFQDKTKLYFVLEYVSGGEFSDYLRVQGKLTKEQVVFFSAEIINILEYLHTFGIAHRDMKPENLLLTQDGHVKCIDFGTARFLANDKRTADLYNIKKGEDTLEMAASAQKKNHRSTFVGTAQYVSPEMLEGSDCGAPADLWALGCMIYLMTVGQFPFIDMNEYLIFQKIKAASVKYPEDMDPEIKDIIQKLLVKEPNARLGAGEKESGNGYDALKGHTLFKNIDFSTLNEQKPPVIEIASPHKKKSQDIQSTGNSGVGIGMHNNRKVNSEDLTKPSPAKTGQAFNFQVESQVKVILSGLVLKKCGWLFYKPRQLILNNKPRLVYYDPDSNQLKGEIPLAPTTKAELESKTKFIVTCPNKKFVFKEMEHSAERWVEIINKTVEQLYAKKPDQ